MLPELSQLTHHPPPATDSPNVLLLYLIFEINPARGAEESAKVALAMLAERVARELQLRGRELAGPKRMEIRYFCRPDGPWMACLANEASCGAASIWVKTRPLTQPAQAALGTADLPLDYPLRPRQLGLPAPEPPCP